MANLFIDKDRRVIPNWRSFGKTSVLGELNSFQNNWSETPLEVGIDDYLIDWNLNKTTVHASDLLSASIVNNYTEHNKVIEAAEFILQNKPISTFSQIALANRILNKKIILDPSSNLNSIDLNDINSIINIDTLKLKISQTKNLIKKYPFNSIFYVELSRYYSILGQEKKSIESMQTALHLAADNRFILRSASRLFAHVNYEDNEYLDYILKKIRNSSLTRKDPWLLSAEISLSTLKGRTSNLIKNGIQLINSKNISPFNYSELASAIGTEELLSGSHKKSKLLFNKALISPNDNSLAQIEWASTKDNRIKVDSSSINIKMNHEALAIENYQEGDYVMAVSNATKWLKDMPFSKRPVMFGSNIATTILKDNNKSISILKTGLISHPNDPQIINNLAYAYALENKPDVALAELSKLKDSNYETTTQACLMATKGLAQFRKGQLELGRENYLRAIKITKELNNKELNWIAILNYAREEIKIESIYTNDAMNAVSKIPNIDSNIEITTLKNEIIDLYNKTKK